MRLVVIEVVAALIRHPEERDRYLVARRAAGQTRAGLWEFPGGKVHAGESHPDALARELREELSIEAEVGPLFLLTAHRYDDTRIRLWTYLVQVDGEPTTGPGHSAVRWMSPDDMLTEEFSAADMPVVWAVRAGIWDDRTA